MKKGERWNVLELQDTVTGGLRDRGRRKRLPHSFYVKLLIYCG